MELALTRDDRLQKYVRQQLRKFPKLASLELKGTAVDLDRIKVHEI